MRKAGLDPGLGGAWQCDSSARAITRDGSDHRRKGAWGELGGGAARREHDRDGEVTDMCKGPPGTHGHCARTLPTITMTESMA